MPRPSKISGNRCPHDAERTECPMHCKYNHFDNGRGLVIDSWELRCLDCGLRDTIGFRSDDEDDGETKAVAPTRCPFCDLDGLCSGVNPCQAKDTDLASNR